MSKKQKVLHLLTSLNAGGAETNLLALLNHFDRDKFEHAVAFGGGGGALEKELSALGVELIQLSPRPLGMRSVMSNRAIVSKIKDYAPDIIHSHLDLVNIFGLLAKKKTACKLILHFHGLGMVPHHLLPNRPFKHRLWNLIAKFYKYCDKALAICNFQLPFLKDLGFDQQQIVMVPNGISLNVALPETTGSTEGYSFVNVGRFQPQKDHKMLIDAFSEVVKQVPDSRLLLVGDGPLRAEIEAQVHTLELDNNVEFLGVRRDIPDILAVNDCFVLGSRWELHPITILEAMRAGLPVIASDVGGVADTVVDGKTGYLTEAENLQSLTDAMLKLAKDRDMGRRMGSLGRDRVKESFNNEKVAMQIEQVYDSVLKN